MYNSVRSFHKVLLLNAHSCDGVLWQAFFKLCLILYDVIYMYNSVRTFDKVVLLNAHKFDG